MSTEERLELLWDHFHKQIDENRAVHRSLESMRAQLTYLRKILSPTTDEEGEDK